MKAILMSYLLMLGVNTYAVDCSSIDRWAAGDIHLGGDQVQHQNNLYQAKWWTSNDDPTDSSVWLYVGHCADHLIKASREASPCSDVETWTRGTIYREGDQISHLGFIYKANWWTQSDDPVSNNGVKGTGEPWTLISQCDAVNSDAGAENPAGGADALYDREADPCDDVAAWVTETVYVRDDVVSHQGSTYRANWWTRSKDPAIFNGVKGTGQPWTLVSVCDSNGGDGNDNDGSEGGDDPDNGNETPDNQPPIANANGPYESIVNELILFSSAGSVDPDGEVIGYQWDFGDGTVSDLANPEHGYASAGEYSVVLTVTDSLAEQTSVQTSVIIKDPETTPPENDKKIIGYFTEWGVYSRNYHVKNLVTSGSADRLTHIVYAFGNPTDGRCSIGDSYAAYEKVYSAADSVDGVADSREAGALRGTFNQFRKLKKQYPNIKIIWSFGGWTKSGGFSEAVKDPEAFAESCYSLINDERWKDVFDGIDIDWEFPNYCGVSCDSSGFDAYRELMAALRARFGSQLVTAAITSSSSKMETTDYGGAAQYLDFYMVMTYDFFGAYSENGPTAPHSPLYDYPGIPHKGFSSDAAVQKLKSLGVPSDKILLGIGFYARGWANVTQEAPGGQANGPAPATYDNGTEEYKIVKEKCPATGTIGGTAYAFCDGNWWGYDTPETILGKMAYVKQQGLAGAFFWQFGGDTSDGELIRAIDEGL